MAQTNGGDDGDDTSKNAKQDEEAKDTEEVEEEEDAPEEEKGQSNDKTDTKVTSDDVENGQEENQGQDKEEHLQLTVAESDKLDTSNVDNEDSLNLTIGEDEAKIFLDEVCNKSTLHTQNSYEIYNINFLLSLNSRKLKKKSKMKKSTVSN